MSLFPKTERKCYQYFIARNMWGFGLFSVCAYMQQLFCSITLHIIPMKKLSLNLEMGQQPKALISSLQCWGHRCMCGHTQLSNVGAGDPNSVLVQHTLVSTEPFSPTLLLCFPLLAPDSSQQYLSCCYVRFHSIKHEEKEKAQPKQRKILGYKEQEQIFIKKFWSHDGFHV